MAEELQAGLLPELAELRRRLAEAEERAAEAQRERDEALATVNISNTGRRIEPTQTIMRTVQIDDLSPEQIEAAAEARHTFAIAHDGKLIGILMPVTAELVEFLVEQNMSRVLTNISQAEAAIAKPARMFPLDQV